MTSVGLVTTVDTNLGDDLIRLGIERLLEAALSDQKLEYIVLNKHRPLSAYNRVPVAQYVDHAPKKKDWVNRTLGRAIRPLQMAHIFESVDFVVQCGTPMIWPECHKAEWLPTVWFDILNRPESPRVVSLAAGSCFPWIVRRPPKLSSRDAKAISRMLQISEGTTFRDVLARDIANNLGFDGPVLPCTAVHWAHGTRADPNATALIINAMPRGGHFLWTSDVADIDWPSRIEQVVAILQETHELIFLCHNQEEYDFASRWTQHERCLPQNAEEYLAVARRGLAGIVNRMHAAVALAGLGVPVLAVGTDTRLLMVEQAGQQTIYLPDSSADDLVQRTEDILANHETHRKRLLRSESRGFEAHAAELTRLVGSAVR